MNSIELDHGIDLMSIFDEESDDGPINPVADFIGSNYSPSSYPPGGPQAGEVSGVPNGLVAGGLASAAKPAVDGAANLSEVVGGRNDIENPTPEDLSFGQYVLQFKEAFIKARPLSEITLYANSMSFKDYMDFVIKMLPKDVKIQGEVNFVHQLASLGPIDKEQYRLNAPDTIEADFCEVK